MIDTFAYLCLRVLVNQQLRDTRLCSSLWTSPSSKPFYSWPLLSQTQLGTPKNWTKKECRFAEKSHLSTRFPNWLMSTSKVWVTYYHITTIQWHCGTLTFFSFFQYSTVSTRQTWHLYVFCKPHMITGFPSGRNLECKNRRTESHFCYCHTAQSGHGVQHSDNHDIPESPWICCRSLIGKIQKIVRRTGDKKPSTLPSYDPCEAIKE